jgi:hypothetical protein
MDAAQQHEGRTAGAGGQAHVGDDQSGQQQNTQKTGDGLDGSNCPSC